MKTVNKIGLGVLASGVFLGLSVFSINFTTNTTDALTLTEVSQTCTPTTITVHFDKIVNRGQSDLPPIIFLADGTPIADGTVIPVTDSNCNPIIDPAFDEAENRFKARRGDGFIQFSLYQHMRANLDIAIAEGTININNSVFNKLTQEAGASGLQDSRRTTGEYTYVGNGTHGLYPGAGYDDEVTWMPSGESAHPNQTAPSGTNQANFYLAVSGTEDTFSLYYNTVPTTTTPELVASCSATPNPANINQSVTFNLTRSGGTGAYTYNWTNACTGTSQNCSTSFTTAGTKTATVTVASGTQTKTVNCSTVVTTSTQTALSATCSASPNPANINQSVMFTPVVTGGTGVYTYQWSQGCTGFAQNCSASYTSDGTKTAFLTVTSGNQAFNTSCQVTVNQSSTSCTQNSYQACSGSDKYWYDSCGNQGSYIGACGSSTTCTQNSYQACSGSDKYWYNSCGVRGAYVGACTTTPTTPNYGNSPLTLLARNITLNSGTWSSSVSANPGNVIQFQIAVKNTTSTTLNNITVRNTLPANLIYNGNLTLDGTANSGNIVNGLFVGNVLPGQTKIISYQAQVGPAQSFSFGTTTLTSTVYTSSSDTNYSSVTSSASVMVTRGSILGATDAPTGWSDNPIFGSFFIPLILAIVGIFAYRRGYLKFPKSKKTY